MIVQCPECKTKFRISAHSLGIQGREVRCGQCRKQWYQSATFEDLAAESLDADIVFEEIPEEEEIVVEETVEPEQEEEWAEPVIEGEKELWARVRALLDYMDWRFVGISFSVFFLLTLIVALIAPLKTIRHFPQTYPIYKSLHLISSSIILHPVDAQYRKDHYGANILYVELEMENISAETVVAEPIEVALHDEAGQVLKSWTVDGQGREVPGLDTLPLKFGLRDAPSDGKTVVIRKDLYSLYGIETENHEQQNDEGH